MSDEIIEKNSVLVQVLGQVSSQLRDSLGNIYNALEHVIPPEKRDGDQELDLNAAILCRSYYRVLRLPDHLSEVAGQSISCPPRLRNDDVVDFCEKLVSRARLPAELLGLELSFVCEKRDHIILMDRERLELLGMNLLSNAFKFTPRGGRVIWEVRVEPRWVELRLTDTGCGIAPELLDTVFDRYLHAQRLDPPPHGLGLGLPICRLVAREHGGTILLTSQPGQGTTVTVSLPNRRSRDPVLGTAIPTIVHPGGFNPTLLGLADALPREAFMQRYLD